MERLQVATNYQVDITYSQHCWSPQFTTNLSRLVEVAYDLRYRLNQTRNLSLQFSWWTRANRNSSLQALPIAVKVTTVCYLRFVVTLFAICGDLLQVCWRCVKICSKFQTLFGSLQIAVKSHQVCVGILAPTTECYKYRRFVATCKLSTDCNKSLYRSLL